LILLSLAATAAVLVVGGLLLDAVVRFPLGGWLAFIGLVLSFLCLALARASGRTRVERWSRDLSRLAARVVRSLSRRRE
jgi:protein-S-isoprenylcysteine O-methyltransferase Ste14